MNKPKDEIAKKTIYEFKNFARKNNFWEEYKRLSMPLRYRSKTFIDVVNKYEPVQLIQSTTVFCC